jgi:hypothetical protein
MMELLHGSSKAKSLKNGMRGGRSCGFVVNVCLPNYDERIVFITRCFQSGCGEEHAPVCALLMGLLGCINSAFQISNHRGY